MKSNLLVCLFVFSLLLFGCDDIPSIKVGFYNVENLFDTTDDPKTNDEYFLPTSDIKWDDEKYQTKLTNLAFVISQISDGEHPDFLGLCEVENRVVIEDLIQQPKLASFNYGIAHIESPDERGIDVGFIYNKDVFMVNTVEAVNVDLTEYDDKTRDILYVAGKLLNGDELHFYINHWPSRSEGQAKSEPKRIIAAKTLREHIDQLQTKDAEAKIIVMGDFNDETTDQSVYKYANCRGNIKSLEDGQLFNAFSSLDKKKKGSYRYKSHWNMLDQIMVSQSLLGKSKESVNYVSGSADIMDESWMKQTGNDYAGFPLRTFGGRTYLAGYSDHFPVSIKLATATK